ncbi:MAG TPA: RraA family protein [Burkholderiales bacterium]|nr:RraA family protein [Burkholderiales bacterium]
MTDNAPIRRTIDRVPATLVAKAKQFQASILADVGGRRGTLGGHIQALARSMKVAGPAFTVEVRPGDNLMIHAALVLAKPGDVIVVDGKGDLSCALTGALMAAHAQKAGIAGFIIDGAVRDTDECARGSFPVFAAGANPNGPLKNSGGRINWPVSVGGTTVNPGDLVVGDADGVVVIPREMAAEIVGAAQAKVDGEAERMQAIGRGELVQGWVAEGLKSVGVLGKNEVL